MKKRFGLEDRFLIDEKWEWVVVLAFAIFTF
ncbi:hypothetical protein VAA_03702 [Vibrio anguillarum 775]|nr:hypothetical protein VAA_03702 [Vibrio anguillarum 775]